MGIETGDNYDFEEPQAEREQISAEQNPEYQEDIESAIKGISDWTQNAEGTVMNGEHFYGNEQSPTPAEGDIYTLPTEEEDIEQEGQIRAA